MQDHPEKAARFEHSAERWEALRRRDPAADDIFWYSVRTTGVYCRPSCAARPARRENVAFHESRAAAERAGFRACKRCRPDQAPLAQQQAQAIAAACRTIENAEDAPTLDALAASAGMSRFHFHRVFKRIAGLTSKAYADAHRARRVRSKLADSGTVTEAIYDAGFNSNGRFYASAGETLGMTPTAYRAGGENAVIRFALGETSLGSILVAATEKGVCAILFGEEPEALLRDLQDRFPKAQLIGADAGFERTVASVIALVETPGHDATLPLDVRGSIFQQRVWQALRRIPAGRTASYADIARDIGQPAAVRAVAQACASNAIAVAIPCHRVVRSDGSLSGYRWGVERKRALLEREAAA